MGGRELGRETRVQVKCSGQQRAAEDRPRPEQQNVQVVPVLRPEAVADQPSWGHRAAGLVLASLLEAGLQVQKPSATLLAEQDIAP